MEIQAAIKHLIQKNDLNNEGMTSVMQAIMTGQCTEAQIAGFLVALRMKGETIDEIGAAAKVMRDLSSKVEVDPTHLIDTCGTGGDGANTFNISTTSAFVVAAAGAKVAKHGNRSVSSKSGSADLLEAAGVKLDLNPVQIKECIETVGIGFMFAPMHHGAMKHAIGPRKELGARTIFNILGPLTNPASAPFQLIGVFSKQWLEPIASVLKQLGSLHVMVVHSNDGLDEISLSDATQVAELKNGEINRYEISPEQFGFERIDIKDIAVDGIDGSLKTFHSVLNNKSSAARDIVCLNAGAAIYVAGLCDDLASGIEEAKKVIANGKAKNTLEALVSISNKFS